MLITVLAMDQSNGPLVRHNARNGFNALIPVY